MRGKILLRPLGVEAQVLLWRFGWSWPLAFTALVLATSCHYAAFLPTTAALREVEAELARLELRRSAEPAAAPPASEQQRLEALQKALRSDQDSTELIRRMSELARAEQIELAQGDYQQQYHASTQILQVQITQPVRASYPQLKRYIESVLRTTPNVSLDLVAARREKVSQTQLDVRLRWSLWIHAPGIARREGRT